MKYRKRPVIINAFKYDGDFMSTDGKHYVPEWAVEALEITGIGGMYFTEKGLLIETLEGQMHVSEGDYVIKGIQGELYPCKPDIFELSYEVVES